MSPADELLRQVRQPRLGRPHLGRVVLGQDADPHAAAAGSRRAGKLPRRPARNLPALVLGIAETTSTRDLDARAQALAGVARDRCVLGVAESRRRDDADPDRGRRVSWTICASRTAAAA